MSQTKAIYTETKKALDQDLLNLAVLGCKELIDAIASDHRVKVTGTKAKIKKLIAKGIIQKSEEPILLKIIDLDISYSRNTQNIEKNDLKDYLIILENLK